MEFKHKKLLDEFNRQVQSGEYEKVGGNGSIVIVVKWNDTLYSPNWNPTAEYRYTMTEKHPDNLLWMLVVLFKLVFTAICC